ncbi:interferon regulatory factor 9 [Ciconia boyciana]|uniref:interferon regulatory factor 9 n=1 Tax=Ciconia boyciana TaxID=52775 RepID=UPI003BA33B6B
MAGGGGRRLRPWLVAQVESGRFAGLVWDDAGRSALRIPWQHAGKGGARGGAGTALCQAWAEFKGRLRPGARPDPAGWKTRLRCALNKSPEFQELPARSRLEGPRPYKVYRLLPPPPPRGAQPPRRGGSRPPREAALGPAAGDGGEPGPQASPPGQEEEEEEEEAEREAEPPEEPRPEDGPAEAPPPAALKLDIMVDSPEPLPPAQGGACLGLRLWLGGALAWQGWLPPGDYLLGPPAPPGAAPPRPGLLPRLLLLPAPEALPGAAPALGRLLAGLRPGLLLSSARRGLFLRRRPGAGPGAGAGELHCRAPHAGAPAPGAALSAGELVQAFDAQRFREELGRHRAGLGPRPEHRVTLAVGQELGPHDGPHNRTLVLQLEQAFAQQLLDSVPAAAGQP